MAWRQPISVHCAPYVARLLAKIWPTSVEFGTCRLRDDHSWPGRPQLARNRPMLGQNSAIFRASTVSTHLSAWGRSRPSFALNPARMSRPSLRAIRPRLSRCSAKVGPPTALGRELLYKRLLSNRENCRESVVQNASYSPRVHRIASFVRLRDIAHRRSQVNVVAPLGGGRFGRIRPENTRDGPRFG